MFKVEDLSDDQLGGVFRILLKHFKDDLVKIVDKDGDELTLDILLLALTDSIHNTVKLLAHEIEAPGSSLIQQDPTNSRSRQIFLLRTFKDPSKPELPIGFIKQPPARPSLTLIKGEKS
jgi:hypothetical protein